MALEYNNPLRYTALECVRELYRDRLTILLDEPHVDFAVDAVNSQVVIRSREIATNGQLGKYIGEHRRPYQKANLNLVVPFPIVLPSLYPATFMQIAQSLRTLYGVVLEEGEFSQASQPTLALLNNDLINTPPNPANGEVELTALPSSGRWVTGSKLRLIAAHPSLAVGLPTLIDGSQIPSLGVLTDAGV